MRLIEVLCEDYMSELEHDVSDFLLLAKSNGVLTVAMGELVDALRNKGRSVSSGNIGLLLRGNPLVKDFNNVEVLLAEPQDMSSKPGEEDKNAEKVSKMAMDAAEQGLKK